MKGLKIEMTGLGAGLLVRVEKEVGVKTGPSISAWSSGEYTCGTPPKREARWSPTTRQKKHKTESLSSNLYVLRLRFLLVLQGTCREGNYISRSGGDRSSSLEIKWEWIRIKFSSVQQTPAQSGTVIGTDGKSGIQAS